MKLQTVIKEYRVLIAIILIAILGSTAADRFNSIKLTSNTTPSLYFANDGDTISNRVSGTLVTNSTIRAKSFIGDSTQTSPKSWVVASNLLYSSYRRTSPTIQQAINGAEGNSIINVRAGKYFEILRLKTGITIVGESPSNTRVVNELTTSAVGLDSGVVYLTDVDSVSFFNLTLSMEYNGEFSGFVDTLATVNIKNCYKDSTNAPRIRFNNVVIEAIQLSNQGAFVYGVKADSSFFKLTNSKISISEQGFDGYDFSHIYLKRSSRVDITGTDLVMTPYLVFCGNFTIMDNRCRITMSNSRLITVADLGSPFSASGTSYARMWNNISNGTFSGTNNLIGSPNNISDVDFYIK